MKLTHIVLPLTIGTGFAMAQAPVGKTPAFEVASIRPHVFTAGSPVCRRSVSGSRVTLPCLSLRSLIMRAYDVKAFQITGGPAWVTDTGDTSYDIVAKAEGEEQPTQEQIQAMLRALLAERFELKVHGETREVPIYGLVVDKNGPKLKDSPADADTRSSFNFGGVRGHMKFSKAGMAQFVLSLTTEAGRPVLDKTGLNGTYQFELDWVRSEPQLLPGAPPISAEALAAASDGPSLFTAVQDQLGLRLESQRGPIEFVVVDHAARPSEN